MHPYMRPKCRGRAFKARASERASERGWLMMTLMLRWCAIMPHATYEQHPTSFVCTGSPSRSRCETVALGNYLKLQQPFVPHRPIQGTKESIVRRATTSDGGKEIFGSDGGPMTFLSLEEAGLIEMSNLDMHERFLARLTVSSLNLLRVISEQENVPISDLNAGKICDWFVKDKAKRKEAINSAVLKWDNGHGPGW